MSKILKKSIENHVGNQSRKVHDLKESERRFCLPGFSVTKIVTWKFHVDKYTNSRYDMILGRDLITALGLDLKFYGNVILGGEVPYKECSVPMVDVINYNYNIITDKTVKPE